MRILVLVLRSAVAEYNQEAASHAIRRLAGRKAPGCIERGVLKDLHGACGSVQALTSKSLRRYQNQWYHALWVLWVDCCFLLFSAAALFATFEAVSCWVVVAECVALPVRVLLSSVTRFPAAV